MHKNSAELPCKDKKKRILRIPEIINRVAIPYPGFVRTASINQDDQSFISIAIDRLMFHPETKKNFIVWFKCTIISFQIFFIFLLLSSYYI